MTDIIDWLDSEGTERAHEARDEILRLRMLVAEVREALDTIARVSNDPAIVTCAKHALQSSFK